MNILVRHDPITSEELPDVETGTANPRSVIKSPGDRKISLSQAVQFCHLSHPV